MATFKLKLRDIERAPVNLPTDEAHLVIATRAPAFRLEVADLHFNFDSAVLLPVPEGAQSGDAAGPGVTGLSVLGACLEYAKDHPDRRAVIAGHTDTVGSPGYNLTLSSLRARTVRAVLVGDRNAWTDVASSKNCLADVQRILAFVASAFRWDCDPGPVDGKERPQTRRAARKFQERYCSEFATPIAIDGVVGPETWGAFFDAYTLELRIQLRTDAPGLERLQKGVTFVDAAHEFVGCGENHPIDAARRDEFQSSTNRRVEILFFDPGDLPSFPCHPSKSACRPAECPIYRLEHFVFEPLPVEADEVVLELAWGADLVDALPKDVTLEISGGGVPAQKQQLATAHRDDSLVHVRFRGIDEGQAITVKAVSGSDELVLVQDQIASDLGNPLVWRHALDELLEP